MGTSKRIAKNSSVKFLATIISIAINIMAMSLLGKYLGVAGYGDYSFWYAMVFIIQFFSDLGLQTIIVREIARTPDKLSVYFGDAIVLKGFLSVIVLVLVWVGASLFLSADKLLLAMVVAGVAVIAISEDISIWIFRGIERMEYEALLVLVTQGCWIGFIWLFIKLKLGLVYLLGASLLAFAIRSLTGFVLLYAKGIVPEFSFDIKRYSFLLKESWPVGISFIVFVVYQKMDTVLLKWLSDAQSVAYFNVALLLSSAFSFI